MEMHSLFQSFLLVQNLAKFDDKFIRCFDLQLKKLLNIEQNLIGKLFTSEQKRIGEFGHALGILGKSLMSTIY
jgi:hypothetical protein